MSDLTVEQYNSVKRFYWICKYKDHDPKNQYYGSDVVYWPEKPPSPPNEKMEYVNPTWDELNTYNKLRKSRLQSKDYVLEKMKNGKDKRTKRRAIPSLKARILKRFRRTILLRIESI